MSEEPYDPDSASEEFDEAGETATDGVEEPSEAAPPAPVKKATVASESATGGVLQPCPNCAALLDVSDEEPFAQVHCPMCGTLMRARTQLKNFALQEVLGSGGMGAVYKALDVNLSRMVALKVVRKEFSSDTEYLSKFEREARITASVNHPHVVKVFSFGSDHGLFYIAMELVDKGSLDDLMALQGRVAELQMLEVGIQIAQGLQAAHKCGLIHRDVKPGNILFADARIAKIVDFGLALLAEHEAEERGEVWGTPYYVAPEKLNQEPEDFRSDIYSLGGTLFHAVAGRPPFEAESASLVALKHIKSRAVSLQAFAPDVSSATAFVINRMLHKDPSHRYQTYDELIEHLNYARAQLMETSAKPRQKQRVVVQGKQQEKFMGILTLGLLAVMLVTGAVVYIYRDRLFHKASSASEIAADAQAGAARYESARKQIISGEFQAAEDVFAELGEQPKLPQPLLNWVTLHEGLSALLADRPTYATAAFKTLASRGIYEGMQPEDETLGRFFATVGRLAGDANVVPPDAVKDFKTTDCGALAPLVFALKDWELGRLEEAGVLFQNFLATAPNPPYAWIAEYKPLVQPYLADLAAFQTVDDQLKAADTPEKRIEAITAIENLSKTVHGKVGERLEQVMRELRRKPATAAHKKGVAEAPVATATPIVEQPQENPHDREVREHDTKLLQETQAKFASLCAGYQFAEALAAVKSVAITDATLTAQRDALLKKAIWLNAFKLLLIQDITTTGYPGPIVKRNGITMAGSVRKASATEIGVQTPYGPIPIPWTDLSPAMILKMAQYFAQQPRAAATATDRQWIDGVFAVESGLAPEGRALLAQAAQSKAEYRDSLSLFDSSTP